MKRFIGSVLLLFLFLVLNSETVFSEDKTDINIESEVVPASKAEALTTEASDSKILRSRAGDKKILFSKIKICVVFLAGIGFIGLLLKRSLRSPKNNAPQNSQIKIIEDKSLGMNMNLLLVQIQHETILLSKCGGTLQFLTRLSDSAKPSENDETINPNIMPLSNAVRISKHDVTAEEKYHANL